MVKRLRNWLKIGLQAGLNLPWSLRRDSEKKFGLIGGQKSSIFSQISMAPFNIVPWGRHVFLNVLAVADDESPPLNSQKDTNNDPLKEASTKLLHRRNSQDPIKLGNARYKHVLCFQNRGHQPSLDKALSA